jgi:hypothetical protein
MHHPLRSQTSRSSRHPARSGIRLCVEQLEARTVPSATGNAWPHPQLVTISFVPDGTIMGANSQGYVYSSLFAKFNAHPGWTTATWEDQILKAAQSWGQAANVNFEVVPDSGVPIGTGNYQQGDPQFGDIRIGAFAGGAGYLASAYLPPPINNFSLAGDIDFNTSYGFNINTTYDLYTVAMHEFGHALGLGHTTVPTAVMYPTYEGVKYNGLASDDVTNIQSVYGARQPDQYNIGTSNNSFATATNLTSQIDPTYLTSVQNNLDLTSTANAEYFTFAAPTGTTGTLTLNVQTKGLSMLRQAVTVYAANESTVLGSASSAGAYGGTIQSLTIGNVTQGEVFYVKVAGADTTAFGTGDYAMTLNFGGGANPAIQFPNTQVANGNPIHGGGGETEGPPLLGLGNLLGRDFFAVAPKHTHASAHHAPASPHHAASSHHPKPTHRPEAWHDMVSDILTDAKLVNGLSGGTGAG